MKTLPNLLRVGAIVAMVCGQHVVAKNSGRLSREELIAKREATREQNSRLQTKKKAESQKHPSQNNIRDRSIVLSSGETWTLVPKGSVYFIPEAYKDRVGLSEGAGEYKPFKEFQRNNRSWLNVETVTMEQARGREPMNEAIVKAMKGNGRVVVTTCLGGVVSVRPFKKKEELVSANAK